MNRGASRLAALIARRNTTQKAIAVAAGIDEGKLSRILHGKALPNRAQAVALQRVCRIAPAAWDEAATRDQRAG